MIYLDHAATTPMRPEVVDAMAPFATDTFGNSSGVHEVSRAAKNALEEARERVAGSIGAGPAEIVFTSGGTESDNLALKGAAWARGAGTRVATAATEHEAVLETLDLLGRFGHPTDVVGVDSEGAVDMESLAACLTPDTAVVSIMYVNNETGVIQDLAGVSELVRDSAPQALIHTDAVQAVSSEGLDIAEMDVDLVSITGHKFGGPKGAGLLYVKEGVHIEPLIHGGGQELGRRSGTHDVAGAVGLAEALRLADLDRRRFRREVGRSRNELEELLAERIEGLAVNPPSGPRSAQHLNVRIPGVRNETLLIRLDRAGVAASSGSACQSGAATVSHVLEGMGLSSAEARESVRFSLGWTSTPSEAGETARITADLVAELR